MPRNTRTNTTTNRRLEQATPPPSTGGRSRKRQASNVDETASKRPRNKDNDDDDDHNDNDDNDDNDTDNDENDEGKGMVTRQGKKIGQRATGKGKTARKGRKTAADKAVDDAAANAAAHRALTTTERKLMQSGVSVAPPERPRASTIPPQLPTKPFQRNRRSDIPSGDDSETTSSSSAAENTSKAKVKAKPNNSNTNKDDDDDDDENDENDDNKDDDDKDDDDKDDDDKDDDDKDDKDEDNDNDEDEDDKGDDDKDDDDKDDKDEDTSNANADDASANGDTNDANADANANASANANANDTNADADANAKTDDAKANANANARITTMDHPTTPSHPASEATSVSHLASLKNSGPGLQSGGDSMDVAAPPISIFHPTTDDHNSLPTVLDQDIKMSSPPNSPPRLHGSSRTTGGILRGHAVGNMPNAADIHEHVSDTIFPVPGKVLVYSSPSNPANLNIETMKPTLFVKHDVVPSLKPVLSKVGGRYSPVQKHHIFTFEDGLWNVRGRYEVACQDDEELVWSTVNGEQITHILISSFGESVSAPTPSRTSITPSTSHHPSPAPAAIGTTNRYHLDLMQLIGIDPELTDRSRKGLQWNYKKYTSYQAAIKSVDTLSSEGKWPVSLKKPSPTELIDIFMSRSYWHSHIAKPFGQVSRYPLMVAWLERGEGDDPSDFEVWHQTRTVYTFAELKEWLKNDGTLDAHVKQKLEKREGKKKGKKSASHDEEEVVDKKGKGKVKVLSEGVGGSSNKKSHRRK